MPKPLKVDLPYPDLNGIEKDYRTAMIIAPAYAGGHSELNAILQYTYHFLNFNGEGDKETAKVLMEIAVAEMEHLEILGTLLYKLGADPIYTKIPPYRIDYYQTTGVSYSKLPVKMLLDDISGEMLAVKEYQNMVSNLSNEKVAAVLTRIILDEEIHIKVLKDLLAKYTTSTPIC